MYWTRVQPQADEYIHPLSSQTQVWIYLGYIMFSLLWVLEVISFTNPVKRSWNPHERLQMAHFCHNEHRCLLKQVHSGLKWPTFKLQLANLAVIWVKLCLL